jgi:hypothetical protein
MEDFLLELLGMILEPLLEAIFQYLIAGLVDLLLRSWGEVFKGFRIQHPLRAFCGYGFFGLILGGISLLFFPHHLIHPSKIHGVSLLISPVLTGLMMWATGAILRRQDRKTTRIESFAYGFAFAFGLAFIRFFFAK